MAIAELRKTAATIRLDVGLRGPSEENRLALSNALGEMTPIAQVVLKREWERVKRAE